MKNKKIKVYLYPNPHLRGETLTNVWGEKFKMDNDPFLEIELCNFPKGEYLIEIFYPIKLKKKVTIGSSYTTVYFFHNKFTDYKLSEVKIFIKGKKKKEKFILPIAVHKVTGKVTNFDGKPFPSYIWATTEEKGKKGTIVRTDSSSRFILYYPEGKKLRLFVDDKSYSKKTLECWIIAKEIKKDIKINPKVGDFELYDPHVWLSDGMWRIFFTPASIKLLQRSKKSGWKLPYVPKVTKKGVGVWINGVKAKIKSIKSLTATGNKYPDYLLEAITKRQQLCPPTLIRVWVDSPYGKGEAWYIY